MSSPTMAIFETEESVVPLKPGWVRIKAVYSVAFSRQTDVCSLVGRIVDVGEMVDELAVGDAIVALAPLQPFITIPADRCQKLPNPSGISENMAFWALALALIVGIRLAEIEIGEQVLVLSNDLVGEMLTDLAWLSGANLSIGVDSAYSGHLNGNRLSQSAPGPLRVESLSTLETNMPELAVHLLIDASGDPTHLQSDLIHVRDLGRLLTVGRYHPSRFDFNVYLDLHKRSLRVVNFRLPKSLHELSQFDKSNFSWMSQALGFVQYLFESGRLQATQWPMVRLEAPDQDLLIQAMQGAGPSTILIKW